MSFAAMLRLEGQTALIVGGGEVALRRAHTLCEGGMRLRVVAPQLHAQFAAVPHEYQARPFQADDLLGVRVVVAATNNAAVNDAVTAQAHALGLLVNHAGDSRQSSLHFPRTHEIAGVRVALHSGRELPMLTQALGQRFAQIIPAELPLERWQTMRAAALAQQGEAKAQALAQLRQEIEDVLGVVKA